MHLEATPLRKLEDPSDWHVHPSRGSKEADRNAMPPPTKVTNKRILDEDSYVEGLSTIIGRDYFPDLPKLKAQAEWLTALQTREPRIISEVRQKILSEQRKFGQTPRSQQTPQQTPVGTPMSESGWGGGTPMTTPLHTPLSTPLGHSDAGSGQFSKKRKSINTNMSLDMFQSKHTSEDNASFLEIHQKDKEKHRQKYPWVYQPDQSTLLLTDGTMMTAEQRLLMNNAANRKAIRGDDRKGQLQQWKYRIRNQCYFYPDLATSRDTCGLPPRIQDSETEVEKTKMLTTGVDQRHRPFAFNAMMAPKAINKNSTRLRGTFLQVQEQAKARQLTQIESQNKSGYSVAGARKKTADAGHKSADALVTTAGRSRDGSEGFSFVPMTPSIEPGSSDPTIRPDGSVVAGASPLMTWGDIDGTPLILDPGATPLVGTDPSFLAGPEFQLPKAPDHERVAHRLEADQRRRRAVRKSTPGASLHRDHDVNDGVGSTLSSVATTPMPTPTPTPLRYGSGNIPSGLTPRQSAHRSSTNGHRKRGARRVKRAKTAADLTPASSYSSATGSSSTLRSMSQIGNGSVRRSVTRTPGGLNPKKRKSKPESSLTDGLLNI